MFEEYGFEFDNNFVYIADNKENCYKGLIRFLEENYIIIYGLSKTSRGNSHDESWHTLYHFINSNNPFSEFIQEKQAEKSSLYVDTPTIHFIDEISDEFLNNWSKKYENYSGEASIRTIYATKFDNLCTLEIKEVFPYKLHQSNTDWINWFFRKDNTILVASGKYL